jgi:heme exporter protein B
VTPPDSLPTTPPLIAARLVIERDLLLAFRRPEQLLHPLAFFMLVTTLFVLSESSERTVLRSIAPGVLWVGALLAALLALDFLFRDDAQDGTLEQYALSGQSLTWLLLGKTSSHWLLTGVPLSVMAPLMAYTLGVLLAILILPLAAPILIFGSRATELAIRGEAYVAPMELLGAIVVLSFTLAPLAAAAAVRISLE